MSRERPVSKPSLLHWLTRLLVHTLYLSRQDCYRESFPSSPLLVLLSTVTLPEQAEVSPSDLTPQRPPPIVCGAWAASSVVLPRCRYLGRTNLPRMSFALRQGHRSSCSEGDERRVEQEASVYSPSKPKTARRKHFGPSSAWHADWRLLISSLPFPTS